MNSAITLKNSIVHFHSGSDNRTIFALILLKLHFDLEIEPLTEI